MSLGLALVVAVVDCALAMQFQQWGERQEAVRSPLQVVIAHPCSVEWCDTRKVVVLRGQLFEGGSPDLPNEVDRAMATLPASGRLLCLASPGGEFSQGTRIMAMIADNRVSTCVAHHYVDDQAKVVFHPGESECDSHCAWLLASGGDRIAFGQHVRVGFHASSHALCGCEVPSYGAKAGFRRMLGAISRQRGDPEALRKKLEDALDWSFEQGYGRNHGTYASTASMLASGILTAVVDDGPRWVQPAPVAVSGVPLRP